MTSGEAKDRARGLFDNWQFWMGVAYVGLGCVVVALWVNFERVSGDQRHTAIVVAERGADIQAQYQACLKTVPVIAKFNLFVQGVQTVDNALLRNSVASHNATPPDSPLYAQQIRNIARLHKALRDERGLRIERITAAS